jgi:hypothetical protein
MQFDTKIAVVIRTDLEAWLALPGVSLRRGQPWEHDPKPASLTSGNNNPRLLMPRIIIPAY